MNILDTRACRRAATWGTYKRTTYRVPIHPDFCQRAMLMVEHLGAVQVRADGRWNWWRWKSKYHEWSVGQGVVNTKTLAIAEVLKGWK